MKLNKDSWHVRFNDFMWNGFFLHNYTDFCGYFWLTVFSVFKLLFISTALVFSVVILSIMWKVTLTILGAVLGLIILIAAFVGTREYLNNTTNEPGFFRLAFRKFKDKTCHKIEWKN